MLGDRGRQEHRSDPRRDAVAGRRAHRASGLHANGRSGCRPLAMTPPMSLSFNMPNTACVCGKKTHHVEILREHGGGMRVVCDVEHDRRPARQHLKSRRQLHRRAVPWRTACCDTGSLDASASSAASAPEAFNSWLAPRNAGYGKTCAARVTTGVRPLLAIALIVEVATEAATGRRRSLARARVTIAVARDRCISPGVPRDKYAPFPSRSVRALRPGSRRDRWRLTSQSKRPHR